MTNVWQDCTSFQNSVQDGFVVADTRPAASLQIPDSVPGMQQTILRQMLVEHHPDLQDEAVGKLLYLSIKEAVFNTCVRDDLLLIAMHYHCRIRMF